MRTSLEELTQSLISTFPELRSVSHGQPQSTSFQLNSLTPSVSRKFRQFEYNMTAWKAKYEPVLRIVPLSSQKPSKPSHPNHLSVRSPLPQIQLTSPSTATPFSSSVADHQPSRSNESFNQTQFSQNADGVPVVRRYYRKHTHITRKKVKPSGEDESFSSSFDPNRTITFEFVTPIYKTTSEIKLTRRTICEYSFDLWTARLSSARSACPTRESFTIQSVKLASSE
ncbi:hypothetical protein BLNAU_4278 [Blattamonas nauphoetae]|uniref:Uncharacterized protein n=1 Tax=Blattamonas nauphoetae TaxID=2049346 RepID=A0ABQ9YAS5_9EUKA|nr:hypothetical protein BLNAU_4278 [Blattamonas nauphoetae]